MMRDEVVEQRHWMTDSEFLDLLAATNLIPGPNSTEMALHIGYKRAGLPGLVVAGSCFIFPACVVVMMIAWGYMRYGETPQVEWVTYGIRPITIAIILQAVWRLARTVSRGSTTLVIGLIATSLAISGVNELVLLAGGGFFVVATRFIRNISFNSIITMLLTTTTIGAFGITVTEAIPVTLTRLTLFFLKVGSVLFGSGYVLLAFLRADLTERWSWITEQQLIDAVTIGQLTPGPVFTTATFIGFLLKGWLGAILATIAIFAPGFVFVAVTHPLIKRLRGSSITSGIVDGVAAASLGLMVAVTWQLGQVAIVDVPTALFLAGSGAILALWHPNTTWLITLGAILGWGFRKGIG